MSEYQKLKARALEAQRAREREIEIELEVKAEQEKQKRRDEDERRKRQEAASREARTLELKKANEAIIRGKQAAKGDDYDPFAEEERRPTPAVPLHANSGGAKTKHGGSAKSNGNGNGAGPSRQTKLVGQDIPRPPLHGVAPKSKAASSSSNGGGGTKKADSSTPPPALGRKEQAARAMMQSAKRSSGSSSIFSVRPNLPPPGSARASGSSSPAYAHLPPRKPVVNASSSVKGKGKGIGRQDVSELRALCPERSSRDQRTIDEIQRDIKARKSGPEVNGKSKISASAGAGRDRDRERDKARSRVDIIPSKSRSDQTVRRRAPSASSSSTTSSSSPPPTKKSRSGHATRDSHQHNSADISSMIQDIFRRPGRPAYKPAQYSDSEGSDDMEAGLSDVEEEERRAIRIARREDEIAEREERERKEKKERARRDREKGLAK